MECLKESAKDITNEKRFEAINSTDFFAVIYYIEDSPENKAKLIWIGSDEDISSQFKRKILKQLEKSAIMSSILKEKKGLAFAVRSGETEYHVYFPPEELYKKVYKNGI